MPTSPQPSSPARRVSLLALAAAALALIAACNGFFIGNNEQASLSLTPQSPTIQPAKTQQFTAKGTFGDGSTRDISSTVTWASSSPAVATIDANGLAGAVAIGSTTITATSGKFTASTTLTVSNVVVTSVTISPTNPTVRVGQTQQFTATAVQSDGSSRDVTSQVVWSTGNVAVATINSSGLATGVTAGSSTITATLGTLSTSTSLTVTSF